MQEIWFNGTKDAEKRDRVKQDIALAQKAFERLAGILEAKKKVPIAADYDRASWAFYRADLDGYQRALTEVLKLIKED